MTTGAKTILVKHNRVTEPGDVRHSADIGSALEIDMLSICFHIFGIHSLQIRQNLLEPFVIPPDLNLGRSSPEPVHVGCRAFLVSFDIFLFPTRMNTNVKNALS